MEFKEVECINKEVIVKIKDTIHLKGLLHHMQQWGFSVMTIQGIRADMNNHGEAYAVIQFLDAVKRRPTTFPKVVAALRDTSQMEIYEIFMKQIRKYYKNKPTRLAEVLSLISEEERRLRITEEGNHDPENVGSHQSSSSGNVSLSQGVLAGHTDGQSSSNTPLGDQWSGDIYRRDGRPPCRDQPNILPRTVEPPTAQTPVRSNTRATSSSSSLSSPDTNSPGATGTVGGDSQSLFPSSDPPALDPTYAGAKISSLKANVYKMLGQALEKKNTDVDDDEPWWNHMIDNGDLNVSREDQRELERARRPGKMFLDILDDRDYTLQDLERLFSQFQINEALNILRQHQSKIIGDRTHTSQSNKNNLNFNRETKAEKHKEMNISIPQTDAPEGPTEQSSSSVQLLQKQASRQPEYNRNSSNISEMNSSPSNQSLDSNTDSNLSSMPSRNIEDESIKGTTAVQAHGDPTRVLSQPNPEDDAVKLRNDRVHQFDLEPGAIENTSFIAINRQEGQCSNNLPTNEIIGDDNVTNSPCDQDGQVRNSEQPGQIGSDTDPLADPGGQDGSSGTVPLLSVFQSMGPNTGIEEPAGGESNETQGVVDIPPRSYVTDDGMSSADVIQRTGVNFVPPSIESQNSREVTEDRSSIQTGASGNDELSGSLSDPDLIHDTPRLDNVASELNEEDSEK